MKPLLNFQSTASRVTVALVLLAIVQILQAAEKREAWRAADGPLATRWAKKLRPADVHPEYPRPQMVRGRWQNLNGLWDYSIRPSGSARPSSFEGSILVPFPIESALSGVMKPLGESNTLWYRRTFRVPAGWSRDRLLLHFGAVDWETRAYLNGRLVGTHRGGYDPFTFDLTDAIHPGGQQELVLAVADPTDAGTEPRGKQVRKPHSIWYTPTSGIWQTVWLEPVPEDHVEEIQLVPDIDDSRLQIRVSSAGAPAEFSVRAQAYDGRREVGAVTGPINRSFALSVPEAKLWSPESPFLYDLKLTLLHRGKPIDSVGSYFGMRKVSLGRDEKGALRICLNNRPYFQLGPLDQGFWPDGLYTAPSDEALRSDIEVLKRLGYNTARKHVKVEPDRWYYWCDKLGLLVWQDMPSGDRYIGTRDPDIRRTAESAEQFHFELAQLIDRHQNHPSIIMWVPFNEGWGQFDTARIAAWTKRLDPTRLVNPTSGWADRAVGDILDIHSYPGPAAAAPEAARAGVLGEFGGLGLPLSGHTWQAEKNWGYKSFKTREELTEAYLQLLEKLGPITANQGLSAAIYTQTTDVEIEVNGLMTYDRELIKMDQERVAAANRRVISAAPK